MARKKNPRQGRSAHDQLDSRSRKILEAVICCYIATAEPVGSRTIARKYVFGLSPATIRNIMADLEELGYLHHPYTSAGRVPTELGYRYYVDLLCHQLQWSQSHVWNKINHLEEALERGNFIELGHILRRVSIMLSATSHYIGVALGPQFIDTTFKQIEFVPLRRRDVLVILVSCSGFTHQKVIRLDENRSQSQLSQTANYLNHHLKGIPLSKVRAKLRRLMEQEKNLYHNLLKRVLDIGKILLDIQQSREVYIEGKLNILDEPEFSNVEKMKSIFQAFEEKSRLIEILDKCLEDKGVYILIGSESHMKEMEDCSLIAAPYNTDSMGIGAVGVIGPTRMEYSSVIPLVEYIAWLTGQVLNEN